MDELERFMYASEAFGLSLNGVIAREHLQIATPRTV
jgi:hypothetical protein